MDGQSVKTTEGGGIRGFDAHKRAKGTQAPHSDGHLRAADRMQSGANRHLRPKGGCAVGLRPLLPNIRTVIADAGHQSRKLAHHLLRQDGWKLQIVKRPARVQDHRPHLDCGAQLRLAWPQSTIEQGLRVQRAELRDTHRNRRNTPYTQPPRSGMRLFKHALSLPSGILAVASERNQSAVSRETRTLIGFVSFRTGLGLAPPLRPSLQICKPLRLTLNRIPRACRRGGWRVRQIVEEFASNTLTASSVSLKRIPEANPRPTVTLKSRKVPCHTDKTQEPLVSFWTSRLHCLL